MADDLPLELVVLGFPEPDVPEPVDIALRRLTFLGDVRVREAAAIAKETDGTYRRREVDHLVTPYAEGETPVRPDVLVPDEVEGFGRMLEPGRSALALVLEHTWINELGEAFRKVRGAVLLSAWLDPGPPAAGDGQRGPAVG
jgi:hypothetical protein